MPFKIGCILITRHFFMVAFHLQQDIVELNNATLRCGIFLCVWSIVDICL